MPISSPPRLVAIVRRATLVLLVAGVVSTMDGPHVAVGQTAERRLTFDVPALPLDVALARYFRLTGIQLLYDSTLTAGRRSSPVRGAYSPREALKLLLTGTGLIARYTRGNAAVIVPADARRHTPLIPLGRVVVRERLVIGALSPRERFRAYYMMLEQDLRRQLRRDKRVSRLSFDMTVRMRIDASGRIVDAAMSSDASGRITDPIVLATLRKLTVARPPSELPQPISLAIKGGL